MKRADILTSVLLVPVDYLMLLVAGLTSYYIRYQDIVTRYRPVFFDYPISEYIPLLSVIALFGILIFALSGSYKIVSRVKISEVLSRVFFGVSTTLLFVIVLIFLQRELFSSRFIIIVAWALAIIFIFVARMLVYKLKSVFLQHGYSPHSVVILGETKAAVDIANHLSINKGLGFLVQGHYANFNTDIEKQIKLSIEQEGIDEIIDVRKIVDRNEQNSIINFCNEHNISFSYLAHLYQTKIINFEVDSIAGYPIIRVHKSPLLGWKRMIKRVTDIFLASLILLILSPLILLIAIIIKLDSRGSIFVVLTRVGQGGRRFNLYKFRSMIMNAHEMKDSIMDLNERSDGPLFKIKNDPRITKVGKFLRKSSLDEVPQFLNVIRGNMSIIGPRPHEPEEIDKFAEESRTLIGAKPGITGLAQTSGRSNLPFKEEVALDIYYIENWSFALDLQILLRTLIVVLRFKNAS